MYRRETEIKVDKRLFGYKTTHHIVSSMMNLMRRRWHNRQRRRLTDQLVRLDIHLIFAFLARQREPFSEQLK